MSLARKARRVPLEEAAFRNQRLNQRVNTSTDERLARAETWALAAQPGPVRLEDYEGRTCFGGLDLSAKQDLTALVLVFPDDAGVYDIVPFFWTPAEQLGKRTQAEEEQLREWVRAGHVELIPGPVIRPDRIADHLGELARRFEIQHIAYDSRMFEHLRVDLADAALDLPMEKFPQGHSEHMQGGIDVFGTLLAAGQLRHFGNPALTVAVTGAVVLRNREGRPMLDKSRSRTGAVRIDGAVALVMALGTARRFVTEYVGSEVVAV